MSDANKQSVKVELDELDAFIARIGGYSAQLSGPNTLTAEEQEIMSEKIDYDVHKLQYRLDRTRRILEKDMGGNPKSVDPTALKMRLAALREVAAHLQEHIAEEKPPLDEMHGHVRSPETLNAVMRPCALPRAQRLRSHSSPAWSLALPGAGERHGLAAGRHPHGRADALLKVAQVGRDRPRHGAGHAGRPSAPGHDLCGDGGRLRGRFPHRRHLLAEQACRRGTRRAHTLPPAPAALWGGLAHHPAPKSHILRQGWCSGWPPA